MSFIRILVADDFAGWRRQIRLLLEVRPELQVICEVPDGAEAVAMAAELKPDLILLDIGLPALNGIEAARRIRRASPSSTIIFVSMDNSLDTVQGALSTGAMGYVYKMHARSELLHAVDAVLRGERFVSGSLKDYESTDAPDTRGCRHEVQFYSDEAVLLEGFTGFIAAALKAGNPAIVIATEPHRDGIFRRLQTQGMDVDAAIQSGSFIPLEVSETLSTFMVDDVPDSARFFDVAGDLIDMAIKAAKGDKSRVAACGECAPLLWAQGKADAAIRLEQLWDRVARIYRVDILCGYALNNFHGEEDEHAFQSICAEHSAVHSK